MQGASQGMAQAPSLLTQSFLGPLRLMRRLASFGGTQESTRGVGSRIEFQHGAPRWEAGDVDFERT